MEGVGQHVMENEGGRADCAVPVGKVKFCVGVQLLIGEGGEVLQSSHARFLLEANSVGNGWGIGGVAIDVVEALEDADPKTFAVEDVDDLFLYRVEAEAGKLFHIGVEWKRREVFEEESQALVSPKMEFTNAVGREHGSPFSIIDVLR